MGGLVEALRSIRRAPTERRGPKFRDGNSTGAWLPMAARPLYLRIFSAEPEVLGAQPGRLRARDRPVDRAALAVRARQVAGRHQELADDLAAGEDEGLLEQF